MTMFASFLKKLRRLIVTPEPPCPTGRLSAGEVNSTAQATQQSPPTQDVVTFDDMGVRCVRRSGLVESVRWDDLRIVFIRTTDQGPFVDDMFWVLGGSSGGCVIPSEANGCQETHGTTATIARIRQ